MNHDWNKAKKHISNITSTYLDLDKFRKRRYLNIYLKALSCGFYINSGKRNHMLYLEAMQLHIDRELNDN